MLDLFSVRGIPELTRYNTPKNLEIKFLGLVPSSLKKSKEASVLLNFSNYRLTGEVKGIAALESLAIGVPAMIHSFDATGYSIRPGILTADNFLKLLTQKKEAGNDQVVKFRLYEHQIKIVRAELSLKFYFNKNRWSAKR